MKLLKRRFFVQASAGLLAVSALGWPVLSRAADMSPDEMIQQLSNEVLELVRQDKQLQVGDVKRTLQVVDDKIMPHVNFRRMTASAVGPAWRRATPEQREQLQQEFKLMLIRTYGGALDQVGDQTIEMRPLRARADDKEVTVRSYVVQDGSRIELDYRMEKTPGEGLGWKIFDLNVAGVWLGDNFRSQFAPIVNRDGIDGLIQTMKDHNSGKK